jgi:dihydroxyacid dehydratase/phosphogluconate dehydratase
MGYGEAMLERPVVGICNTASGFNNCHRLLPELIEAVKRGTSQEMLLSPRRVSRHDPRRGAPFRGAHIGQRPLR